MSICDEIPTELVDHLEWRIALQKECRSDPKLRKYVWDRCAEDLLFFISAFVQIYEPRRRFGADGKELPKVIPFIPWPHQKVAIGVIDEHLGIRDIGVDKARGEGASWIGVATAVQRWNFNSLTAVGVVSKDEAAATNIQDPDSLFWKIDFILKRLPNWMRPDYRHFKSQASFVNNDNGSVISGYACTGDVASGGRKLFFLMDELGKFPRGPDQDSMTSTLGVTDSRLIVSTFKGSDGAYFQVMRVEDSDIVKIDLKWQDNPTRNKGLYLYQRGTLVEVDPENNPLPKGYAEKFHTVILPRLKAKGFVVEGTMRSPWYDELCLRPAASPEAVAQDYDRNPHGVEHKPFQAEFMAKVGETVEPPYVVGRLVFSTEDPKKAHFEEDPSGNLKLWLKPDKDGRAPEGIYGVACDISQGVGASNSAATAFNLTTGTQVAALVTNRMPPADFSRCSQALCWWLHEAELAWEVNGGTGTAFSQAVDELNYANLWRREVVYLKGLVPTKKKEVGWYNGKGSKMVIFEDFDRAVKTGRITVKDAELMKEFSDYKIEAGKLVHRTLGSESDGGAHGDRVVSASIGGQQVRSFTAAPHRTMKVSYQPGTVGHRRQQIEDESRERAIHDDPFNW